MKEMIVNAIGAGGRVLRILATAAALASGLLLAGCGTMQFKAGQPFDTGLLERTLKTGASTQADVRAALGAPYGQGRAMLPFHDAARTVWTYFTERGSMNLGNGEMQDQRTYLFVFFAGERLDSYMWFDSALK
jgi:hypothetical protein